MDLIIITLGPEYQALMEKLMFEGRPFIAMPFIPIALAGLRGCKYERIYIPGIYRNEPQTHEIIIPCATKKYIIY